MRIKRLTETDNVAFKMLADCGNANTASLMSCGISQTRIENYKRDGFIRQVGYEDTRGHKDPTVSWGVTPKGRDFIKQNYGINTASSVNAPRHNTAVAVEYVKFLPREDGGKIYNERTVRIVIEDRLEIIKDKDPMAYLDWKEAYDTKKMGMPDITYVMADGTIECVEIITNSYGILEMESKQLTFQFLEATYTMINIDQ